MEKNQILSIPVTGLSLITSCGCNLDCEYCRIAQARHHNSDAAKLQSATIQALKDGTFRQNVADTLYILGQTPNSIDTIAFWGQEPTLTLDLITEHIDEWLALFPQWQFCSFSTNAVAYIDKIFDFIKAIDSLVKYEFRINVQFSYDGEYGTEQSRNASVSDIYNNVMTLLEKLNNLTLNHVYCDFHFHAVLSKDLIYKLQDTDEFIKYYSSMLKWSEEFSRVNRNNHVILKDWIDIGLENPLEASAVDGITLAHLCELAMRLDPSCFCSTDEQYRNYQPYTARLTEGSAVLLSNITDILHNKYHVKNLTDMFNFMTEDHLLRRQFFNDLNPLCYCGNGVGELKIMYDGTLINCQNHIYDQNLNMLPTEDKLENHVKKSLLQKHYFVNPLKDDAETIEKYFYTFYTCKFQCLETIFRTNITTMEALLHAGQIHPSYHDQMKLMKHALLLTIINCCSYNNQMMAGSLFLRHSGFLRLMCNGYFDYHLMMFNNENGEVVF